MKGSASRELAPTKATQEQLQTAVFLPRDALGTGFYFMFIHACKEVVAIQHVPQFPLP